MNPPITGPLATALAANRPRFNAQFAQAKHHAPALDPRVFGEHLRDTVAPIVDSVAQATPVRVNEVVEVLYEFSLDLAAKDLLGKSPLVREGWKELLGGLPAVLASAPRLFAGSVTNALHNLSLAPGARGEAWMKDMRRLGERWTDAGALLEAGKVVAWRAGLAQLRSAALDICQRLDPGLASAALGLPGEPESQRLAELIARLRTDPWAHPAALLDSRNAERRLRVMARVGGFRGLGGPFVRPPTVSCTEGQLLVSDGESCWTLTADIFGHALHRAGDGALPAAKAPSACRVTREGKVTWGKDTATFEELQHPQSFAASPDTLAVTLGLSHHVYLLARPLMAKK
jgi:hypothetical protein